MSFHDTGLQRGHRRMRHLATFRGMAMRFRTFALLGAALALPACGTDEVGPTGFEPNQPTGRIRFVHAISGTTPVNVTVDAVPLGVSIAYAGTAPAAPTLYYSAYAGNRQFAVRRTADTSAHL